MAFEDKAHFSSCNKRDQVGNGAHEFAPQNDTGRFVCRRRDVAVDSKCCEHKKRYDKRGSFAADSLPYQRNHWDEQYGYRVDPDKLDAQREPANLMQRDFGQGIDVHRNKQAGGAIKERGQDDLFEAIKRFEREGLRG